MEKNRVSVISKRGHFVRHSRKTLFPGQAQFRFYELHPDPRRVEAKRRENAEQAIFDILINNPSKMIEEIEIKHITREK